MTLRLFVERALVAGDTFDLPEGAARHAQVRRLQPGDALVLFDGRGGEWRSEVESMGRRQVAVRVLSHDPVQRETLPAVTIALGMPANERMDTLVEKATELGVAAIQPLVCERSVLRLDGERAERKRQHWQAIAVAASEQCGRTRLPQVGLAMPLTAWLGAQALSVDETEVRWLLSLAANAQGWQLPRAAVRTVTVLSGPEGGLTEAEQDLARRRGFCDLGLGPRVLRADTAPLVVLAALALAG